MKAAAFLETLRAAGLNFFTGVPDSLMKVFLQKLATDPMHFGAANEGAAVAMASGYHMATGEMALVYLQNSGLGNLVNPITSLANKDVYSVPMVLLIGWRGQPGRTDEPQHRKMGAITLELLQLLDIPYVVCGPADNDWQHAVRTIAATAKNESRPAAIVVEEGFFSEEAQEPPYHDYELSAALVLETIYPSLEETIVVTTTGKIGRLFYDINLAKGQKVKTYLMNAGAMGHAGALATSLAMFSKRKVTLLDGDGALLMHMGSLATTGVLQLDHLRYILLNNGAHQSVGAQPTVGFKVDFCTIAKGCGFRDTICISNKEQLLQLDKGSGNFIEIRINTSMPDKLSRPAESFVTAKQNLMNELKQAHEPGTDHH